jgi:hypothetical protein
MKLKIDDAPTTVDKAEAALKAESGLKGSAPSR